MRLDILSNYGNEPMLDMMNGSSMLMNNFGVGGGGMGGGGGINHHQNHHHQHHQHHQQQQQQQLSGPAYLSPANNGGYSSLASASLYESSSPSSSASNSLDYYGAYPITNTNSTAASVAEQSPFSSIKRCASLVKSSALGLGGPGGSFNANSIINNDVSFIKIIYYISSKFRVQIL